jgi:hypothetical protein
MVDGLWGKHEWMLYPQPYCHESPYLAWLWLLLKNATSNILTSSVHKLIWQVHPSKSNIYSIDPRVLGKFKAKLENIKGAISNPFHEVINDTHFPYLQPSKNAYAQAFEALYCLGNDFRPWCDFVEVVQGLQCNLLELLAFTDWWHDVQ